MPVAVAPKSALPIQIVQTLPLALIRAVEIHAIHQMRADEMHYVPLIRIMPSASVHQIHAVNQALNAV